MLPQTFIRKKVEVICRWESMTPEQKIEFEKYKHTVIGDDSEAAAFSNFSKLFRREKYEYTRIFSMNGIEFLFPDAEFTKEITGEYDQIIVAEEIKTIVYVEYKATFSGNHARKKQQFIKFRSLLDTHFPIDEGWVLVTSYGFAKYPACDKNNPVVPCATCQKFVFLVQSFPEISAWFNSIISLRKQQLQGMPIAYKESEAVQIHHQQVSR